MIRSLRRKFVCINMTLIAVMLVAILSALYISTRTAAENSSIQILQEAAMRSGIGSRPAIPGQDGGQPCFILSESVWGDLIVSGDDYYDLTDTDWLLTIYRAAKESGATTAVLREYSLRFLRAESPMGTKYVFTDITSELQSQRNMLRNFLLIGLAAFGVFLLISILLARWAVNPAEKAWRQQQQFVADASHELKTPLTVILTNAELLQDPQYDAEARSRLAENILSMSRQMRGLVEGLLQLARADSGQTRAAMEPLDLSRLVSDSLLPFEPLFFEQGMELRSYLEPDIAVTGSASQLTQLVDILLDNALKYSAPGAAVEVSLLRQSHGKLLLRLFSPGQSMDQQTCRDIFKRFYRVDEARNRSGSFGLGLSIAQEIVTAHRGRIWAEPVEGGNLFCVSL